MSKSSMTNIANQLEKVPQRVESARKVMETWRTRTLRMVKRNPGRSILGAFAIAFLLGKVSRFV